MRTESAGVNEAWLVEMAVDLAEADGIGALSGVDYRVPQAASCHDPLPYPHESMQSPNKTHQLLVHARRCGLRLSISNVGQLLSSVPRYSTHLSSIPGTSGQEMLAQVPRARRTGRKKFSTGRPFCSGVRTQMKGHPTEKNPGQMSRRSIQLDDVLSSN